MNSEQSIPAQVKAIINRNRSFVTSSPSEARRQKANNPNANFVVRENKETMPNEKCPCKSGKKFKKCCMYKVEDYKVEDTVQADADIQKATSTKIEAPPINNGPYVGPDYISNLR